MKHLFADRAYDRTQLMDKAAFLDLVIEVVRRIDDEPGFKVAPRRWVVERTLPPIRASAKGVGWITRWRRLVRDHEQRIDVSEAMSMSPSAACCCAGSAIDAIPKWILNRYTRE